MTTPLPQPDPSTIQSWIDQRLDADAMAQAEALLGADPAWRDYAEHGRRQNRLLRDALDPLLDEAVPERLRQAALGPTLGAQDANAGDHSFTEPIAHVPASVAPGAATPAATAATADAPRAIQDSRAAFLASGRSGWRMAAGIILAMALGFAGGWVGRDRIVAASGGGAMEGSSLSRAATVAHAAYTPEVRHPVEVAASDQAHLVAWLSKRLGTRLRVPDLSEQGYLLIGGRLLPDATGAVAAQFMFECNKGTRLTLFVRRDQQGSDTAFRFTQDRGVSTFYWLDRGYGYALSGDQPRDLMLTLANSVYRQLNP